MLNTIGWVTFYWHFKHLSLITGKASVWRSSSSNLMGWLRDYLWFNSSPLINGYGVGFVTGNALWAWMGNGLHVPHLMAGVLARAD